MSSFKFVKKVYNGLTCFSFSSLCNRLIPAMGSTVKNSHPTRTTNPRCGQKTGLAGKSWKWYSIGWKYFIWISCLVWILCLGTPSSAVQTLVGQPKIWRFRLQGSYKVVVHLLTITWWVDFLIVNVSLFSYNNIIHVLMFLETMT